MDREAHRAGQPVLLLLPHADFGSFFLKFCSYFPYNAKLCLDGNEWAKRQAAKAGIGFEPLDNGFAAVDDPTAVQAICDQLGPDQIDGLLRKWLHRLPHPFSPADRAAGYRYDFSILQAEFSLTQMLDAPVSGRVFYGHITFSGSTHLASIEHAVPQQLSTQIALTCDDAKVNGIVGSTQTELA